MANRLIFLGMMILLAGGVGAYLALGPTQPPPPEIAADPLLVRGRDIYLERCVSCHGTTGKGDGPLAKGLSGPAPRNLVEEKWKHGDRPQQVLEVLANGIKDAQMPAWSGTYSPEDLKAVAGYVYHLAGRAIPEDLRPK